MDAEMSQPSKSGATAPARLMSSARWCLAAASSCIAGVIASFFVGGFVILVFGIALLRTAGDGSGSHQEHAEFIVMLVLGPAIVGACTFGAATIAWLLPRMPAQRASPTALAVSSALVTLGFVATHRPGYIDYINKAPSIIAYVAATTLAAAIAVALWHRRQSTSHEP